jgi:hypothetical protein
MNRERTLDRAMVRSRAQRFMIHGLTPFPTRKRGMMRKVTDAD